MRLRAVYRAAELPPFEGDRVVGLHGLPADARVVEARATIAPDYPQFAEFREIADFSAGGDRFGSTVDTSGGAVVADFHARRVVVAADVDAGPNGSTLTDVNAFADLGGMWGGFDANGSLLQPGATADIDRTSGGIVALPDVATSRLRLAVPGATFASLRSVTFRTYPANVSVRLGAQGPFWVEVGELTEAAEVPDFEPALSAYLHEADVENGHYVVPFTIHSDGLARLALTVEVEYVREQSLLPAGVPDVALSYGYDRLSATDRQLTVDVPSGAVVSAEGTRASLTGDFDPTRIAFTPGDEKALVKGPQRVGGGVSLAQPVQVPADLEFSSIDVLVAPLADKIQLTGTLVEDADGKPWGEALLPAPVRFVMRPEVGGDYQWANAPLPEPLQLTALRPDGGVRTYWMVLNADVGSANWAAAPAAAGAELYRSIDDGLSWQEAGLARDPGPLAGLFRLRHVPGNYEMPVALRVGDGTSSRVLSLDRFAAAGRVDLTLSEELAAGINEVAAAALPAACPEVEHLVNGDFTTWLNLDVEGAAPLPEDWDVTGDAEQEFLPDLGTGADLRSAVRLDPPPNASGALSQVAPVVPGCSYRFGFLGCALQEGAQAQLIWRSADCSAERIDSIELNTEPEFDPTISHEPSKSGASLLHRLDVKAPPAADQVEVRFLAPPGNRIVVGATTLAASTDVVANPDLAAVEDGGIAGWDLPAGLAKTGLEGPVLANSGTDTAVAAQAVPATGGAAFTADFAGRTLVVDDGPPQLEIAWVDASGASVGAPVAHPIELHALDRHTLAGTAPQAAVGASIRLVVPPGAALEVHEVSFRSLPRVSVPISFDTQSPGEIVVTEAVVALDQPAPAPPPAPAAGLCSTTPPGAIPGRPTDSDCYCPGCGKDTTLERKAAVVTAAGRPAVAGTCVNCGTDLVHAAPATPVAEATIEASVASAIGAANGRRRLVRPDPARAALPVTAVLGIGPVRSRGLADLGITTVTDLAAAPVRLIARLESVNPSGAADIRRSAARFVLGR